MVPYALVILSDYSMLAVSYGISSMSSSCRVQEIWSHKITNAYRAMKHGLLQGLTAPIVMGMSQYLTRFYEPQFLLYPMVQVSCL